MVLTPKPEPAIAPLAYTMEQAAKCTGLHKSTLYRLAEAGSLRLTRIGGRTLVRAEELADFLKRHERGHVAA